MKSVKKILKLQKDSPLYIFMHCLSDSALPNKLLIYFAVFSK